MGQIKAGRVDLNKQTTDGTELTLSQKINTSIKCLPRPEHLVIVKRSGLGQREVISFFPFKTLCTRLLMFGMVWKGIDYFHPHSKFNNVNEDKLHKQREIALTGYHRTKCWVWDLTLQNNKGTIWKWRKKRKGLRYLR